MGEQETDMMQEAREALAARKENRRKQNPTEIAHKMYRMNFEGNIIPHSWYTHIKRESGKPYTIAIVLLSEIVYWYRPKEVKDEKTGQIIGLQKRYAADKLQRTYDSFSNQFGFTKRQVKDALKHLEDLAIIDLDLRDIPVGDSVAGNVLFIGLDPDRLAEITYLLPSDEKTLDPPPSDKLASEVYQFNARGLTENRQTNTEITQETTTETKEDISFPEKTKTPDPGGADSGKERTDEQEADNDYPAGRDKRNGVLDICDGEPIRMDNKASALPVGLGVGDHHIPDPIVEAIIEQTETHPDEFDLARRTAAAQAKTGNYAVPGEDVLVAEAITCLCRGKAPKKGSGTWRDMTNVLKPIHADWGLHDEEVGEALVIIRAAIALFLDEKQQMAVYKYPSFAANYGQYLSRAMNGDRRQTPHRNGSAKYDEATRLTLERLNHGDH